MFSCWWFEEPNLPHSDPSLPLLTGSPSLVSSSYSHYLLAGMRHIVPLIPGPLPPLSLPSLGWFSLEHFLLFLPSPSCAPGTAIAGFLKVPCFLVSAPQGGFRGRKSSLGEDISNKKGRILGGFLLLLTALGYRGTVFGDHVTPSKERPEPTAKPDLNGHGDEPLRSRKFLTCSPSTNPTHTHTHTRAHAHPGTCQHMHGFTHSFSPSHSCATFKDPH